jgi:4-hydroxybenzoate polyprenyltransferase
MKTVLNFLKIMRPAQWFKSIYVLVGAIPAILLMPIEPVLILYLLFFGIVNLILIQGIIYIINDFADIESDRKHPVKKFRPIASGVITKREGIAFAIFLLAVAIFIAISIDIRIFYIDIALLLINSAYSLKPLRLKDREFFDIFSVAFNFPLRVMVGWFLFEPYNEARLSLSFNVMSSKLASSSIQYILFNLSPRVFNMSITFSSVTLSFISIMLFTYFLACFLLSEKRIAEKLSLKNAGVFRMSLKQYNLITLKIVSIVSVIIVLISFILFTLSFKFALIFLTIILVYTISWYYKLAFVKNSPVMYPEKIITGMPKFIALAVISIILTLLIIFI